MIPSQQNMTVDGRIVVTGHDFIIIILLVQLVSSEFFWMLPMLKKPTKFEGFDHESHPKPF